LYELLSAQMSILEFARRTHMRDIWNDLLQKSERVNT